MTHSEIWEEKFLLLVIANRKAGMPMSEAKSSAFADIIVQMTLARLERVLSPVSVTATVIPNDDKWHDFPPSTYDFTQMEKAVKIREQHSPGYIKTGD